MVSDVCSGEKRVWSIRTDFSFVQGKTKRTMKMFHNVKGDISGGISAADMRLGVSVL
jgi:hypothetical protein